MFLSSNMYGITPKNTQHPVILDIVFRIKSTAMGEGVVVKSSTDNCTLLSVFTFVRQVPVKFV